MKKYTDTDVAGTADYPKPKLISVAPKGLKARQMEYNSNWATKGGKLGEYICPCCSKKNQTPMPNKKDVSDKGYWDSLTTCYECGDLFFVFKYPNGQILINTLN